jgi:hypothetical protein
MEKCGYIMVIVQEHRVETAARVQEVLTRYGCNIRVRLGLHDAGLATCSNSGMILLQVCGEKADADQLLAELLKVPKVKAKLMSLDF